MNVYVGSVPEYCHFRTIVSPQRLWIEVVCFVWQKRWTAADISDVTAKTMARRIAATGAWRMPCYSFSPT